jgi:hypothetical protein
MCFQIDHKSINEHNNWNDLIQWDWHKLQMSKLHDLIEQMICPNVFLVNWLLNGINLNNFWLELNYIMKWKIMLVLVWKENVIEMPSHD